MTMRRIAFLLACCAPALAACGTASVIDNAVPVGAHAQPASGPVFAAPGQYPNLNVVPTPAAPQFTSQQTTDGAQELRERRDRLARETTASAEDRSDELRRIGSRHADEALKRIEGQ